MAVSPITSTGAPSGDARFRSCSPRSWPVSLTGIAAWYLSLTPSTPLAVTRFPFILPEGQTFSAAGSPSLDCHVAGWRAAGVCGRARAAVSPIDVPNWTSKAIQGTEGYQSVTDPVFSPDGRSVAFFALRRSDAQDELPVTGGAAVTICPADTPFGISWGPDGIVFGQGRKGIMRVSAEWRHTGRDRARQGR